jgi:hypothetical protein
VSADIIHAVLYRFIFVINMLPYPVTHCHAFTRLIKQDTHLSTFVTPNHILSQVLTPYHVQAVLRKRAFEAQDMEQRARFAKEFEAEVRLQP